jgi:hypothetical protein
MSAIFVAEDDADLHEEDIKELIRALPVSKANSELTFKRNADGYTFVNFNFEVD